jgi:hypothetical protein
MPSAYLRRMFPTLYERERELPLGLSVPAFYFILGMFTGAAITLLSWLLFAPKP